MVNFVEYYSLLCDRISVFIQVNKLKSLHRETHGKNLKVEALEIELRCHFFTNFETGPRSQLPS